MAPERVRPGGGLDSSSQQKIESWIVHSPAMRAWLVRNLHLRAWHRRRRSAAARTALGLTATRCGDRRPERVPSAATNMKERTIPATLLTLIAVIDGLRPTALSASNTSFLSRSADEVFWSGQPDTAHHATGLTSTLSAEAVRRVDQAVRTLHAAVLETGRECDLILTADQAPTAPACHRTDSCPRSTAASSSATPSRKRHRPSARALPTGSSQSRGQARCSSRDRRHRVSGQRRSTQHEVVCPPVSPPNRPHDHKESHPHDDAYSLRPKPRRPASP